MSTEEEATLGVDDLLRIVWSALEREMEAFNDESAQIDMVSIEQHAKKLCDEMSKLSRDEAKQYESDLKLLYQQISEFSENLKERRDTVRQKIEKLNQFSNASKAYRSTPSEMAASTGSDQE